MNICILRPNRRAAPLRRPRADRPRPAVSVRTRGHFLDAAAPGLGVEQNGTVWNTRKRSSFVARAWPAPPVRGATDPGAVSQNVPPEKEPNPAGRRAWGRSGGAKWRSLAQFAKDSKRRPIRAKPALPGL